MEHAMRRMPIVANAVSLALTLLDMHTSESILFSQILFSVGFGLSPSVSGPFTGDVRGSLGWVIDAFS